MHIHVQLLMRPAHIDDDYLLCIQKSAPSTSFFKKKMQQYLLLVTMHVNENECKKMYMYKLNTCGELKK